VNATTTKINDLALFNLFQSHIKRKKKFYVKWKDFSKIHGQSNSHGLNLY
jgi:hypothetical protein